MEVIDSNISLRTAHGLTDYTATDFTGVLILTEEATADLGRLLAGLEKIEVESNAGDTLTELLS